MMLEGIPIVDLSAQTILAVGVILILLGRIVPRSVLNDKAAETERWRIAYESERSARALADAQTQELLTLAKTTHTLLIGLFGQTGQIEAEDSNGTSSQG